MPERAGGREVTATTAPTIPKRARTLITMVHRSEVLANPTKAMQALVGMVERGKLARLLVQEPRLARAVGGANRRLSPAAIDQLVADYRSGAVSIYDLADLYGVHRNTIAQHLKDRGVRLGPLPLQASEAKRARRASRAGAFVERDRANLGAGSEDGQDRDHLASFVIAGLDLRCNVRPYSWAPVIFLSASLGPESDVIGSDLTDALLTPAVCRTRSTHSSIVRAL